MPTMALALQFHFKINLVTILDKKWVLENHPKENITECGQ